MGATESVPGSAAEPSDGRGDRPHGPAISPREVVAAVLVAIALAVVMNWPVPSRMTKALPVWSTGRPGAPPVNRVIAMDDPMLEAWEIAWGGHAIVRQPLHYFDSNAFWPLVDTLAFSDALIGYAPTGLIGRGVTAAVVRYNLLFLFAYFLAFLGAFLLARELGAGPVAAAVAGVAFAYAPWRLSQVGHLNVLSTGGIPLALFFLLRGFRRRKAGLAVAGWATATWQMSLGFAIGLQFAYLVAALTVLAAVLWLRRGRPALDRRFLIVNAVGLTVFLAGVVVLALPYLDAVRRYPEARRTVATVSFFSPPLKGFLAAPEHSLLWGRLTRPLRDNLPWPEEQTLFPGIVAPALALVALVAGTSARSLRIGLAAAGAGLAALALGFHLAGGRFTYRLLYDFAPGWQGIRTPGRLMTLATLALALLASLGSQRVLSWAGRKGRALRVPASALLLALVLLEGAGHAATTKVPPRQPPIVLPDPQIHLPVGPDSLYMLWSVDGFPRLVNGYSGTYPNRWTRLIVQMTHFPSPDSVRMLRTLGIRTVIVHPDLVRGTGWAKVLARPLDGLPVERLTVDDTVVFRVIYATK